MSGKVTPITPNQDAIMRTRGLPAQYIEGGPGAEDPRLAAKDAEIERLRNLLEKLTVATGRLAFAAETSGGTAGRDEGLCAELGRIADPLGQARAALGASLPPRAVKVDVSKEWCIAAAEQEGNLSIGAGAPPPPSDEGLPLAQEKADSK